MYSFQYNSYRYLIDKQLSMFNSINIYFKTMKIDDFSSWLNY